jgi:hypothetical protein
VTGTRSGLAWVEEHDKALSFHPTGMGPAGLGKFETRAAILELALGEPEDTSPGEEPSPAAVPTVDGDLDADIIDVSYPFAFPPP